MKKFAIWIVIAIVALWVINSPAEAGDFIQRVTTAFTTLATSL